MTDGRHAAFLGATLPALDLVYNLARRVATSPHEVEDLVQETYLRAYSSWARGRRPRKVAPWLATICLNTGRTWQRRSRPEVPLDTLLADEPSSTRLASDGEEVVDAALEALDRDIVREALLRLPEEQRVAIALMDLAGFTASEAAGITGSPRGTILARVHRGRKRLALVLERRVMLDDEA